MEDMDIGFKKLMEKRNIIISGKEGIPMDKRKVTTYILSGLLILVLVANIYGFARGQFHVRTFWAVLIVVAILAYWVIPRLSVPE